VLTPEVAMLAPAKPDAFAAALDRLLGDAELRARLGAQGSAFAQREFSKDAFERKLARFVGEVEQAIGRGSRAKSRA
jgi:glycosyltransferase involved in cell wall biosynthesis